MAKGWTAISIKEDLEKRLRKRYEKDKRRPANQAFTAYVDTLLNDILDYTEKVDQYGAFLQYDGAHDNRISLFDNLKKKSVTVFVNDKEKKLVCELDQSDCCLHVGYAFAVKEVYDILIAHGFRLPKNIQ